jgi:hypothetical protein
MLAKAVTHIAKVEAAETTMYAGDQAVGGQLHSDWN